MVILASIKFIEWLFSSMLLFTPLIFSTNTGEAFEFPKMFFIYLIGSTTIFAFILRRVLGETKNPIVWPNVLVLLFVLANVISTVFSSHLYTSIWGYYSRFNGGLVSILIFFGIYVVGINTFKQIRMGKLLLAPIFTLVPISTFAVFQHYYFSEGARVYSTFGQPNWLAAYISMVLPLVLYFALKSKVSRLRLYFLLAVFITSYAALWFTYSMSGLIGFVVGIGLLILLNQEMIKKNFRLILGVFLLCGVISLLNLGVYKERFQDIFIDLRKVQAQTEEVDIANVNIVSDPAFIRLNLWKGTKNLIFSSPKVFLIGTGPETFPYEFQPFRPKILNYSSEWNYILNKPHNYYLETISEIGLFGLLPYLGIIYYSIKKKHPVITPCLLAFYVTNFFGFPVVATSLLFWVFLAKLDT